MHVCPLVTVLVPHVGGPITAPSAPNVLIGKLAAAGVGSICTCVGPPDVIATGAWTVLIGGRPAARMLDTTAHGGKVVTGCFTVLIGTSGAASPGGSGAGPSGSAGGTSSGIPTPSSLKGAKASGKPTIPQKPEDPRRKALDDAIAIIEKSEWAKTEEGKKVLAKVKQLDKDGKIVFSDLGDNTRGAWSDGKIKLRKDSTDPDLMASELVHEATHAVNEDELPRSKTKLTIDEEMRTNTNQLDLYKEQKKNGWNDPELDRRQRKREKGRLRDDVRKRYPGTPEQL